MEENNRVFACSRTMKHIPGCDGFCGTIELTSLEIELNEERRLWDEAGMKPVGTIYGPGVPPGIPVDVHHTEVSVAAIVETLVELNIVPRDVLNGKFQQLMLDSLRKIRKGNEEKVREHRVQELKQKIAPSPPPIFLPDHIAKKKSH